MNILLVEPDSRIGYQNIALMKISAKHKKAGDKVIYYKGQKQRESDSDLFDSNIFEPDIIYISTLFTYYSEAAIECIKFYKETYPKAEIKVGGIFASMMPEYIEKETGIKPFVGHDKELDVTVPDYDMVPEFIKFTPKIQRWEDFSVLFTHRGCPRRCNFCAIQTLEPNFWIVPNWKELVKQENKSIMIQDNNITAAPQEHFEDVFKYLIDRNLKTCFNNGFDARLTTDEHIKLMSKVRWTESGLRLAFDNMTEDGYAQEMIHKLLELGVPKYTIMVFILFNFKDDFEEAMYRAGEIRDLKVRPYPMPYKPLNWLDESTFVSEKWTLELIREYRQYWLMARDFKYKTFDKYLEEKGKKLSDLMPK